MKQQDTERNLASARAAVSEATQLVTHPTAEALDRSAALLGLALERLRAVAAAPVSPDPAARLRAGVGLGQLSRSMQRLRSMLDHAASYWAGWIRLRDSMASGYTGQGEPAQAVQAGRLLLEA